MYPLFTDYYCNKCDPPGGPPRDLGPFYGWALYEKKCITNCTVFKHRYQAYELHMKMPDHQRFAIARIVSVYEITWASSGEGSFGGGNYFALYHERPKKMQRGDIWFDYS